jgi:hypothetical protein
MKTLKYALTLVALVGALAISAKADLLFLGAVDFNNGPNSPAANLAALGAFGVDTSGFDANNPTTNIENLNGGDQNIDVLPGEFLVVHFGKGEGGTGSGGSLEFFQVINGETNVTVPGTGNGPNNPDQFGHGGISSIRGFGGQNTTPDSGATVMLLGGALAGLGLVRHYLKR